MFFQLNGIVDPQLFVSLQVMLPARNCQLPFFQEEGDPKPCVVVWMKTAPRQIHTFEYLVPSWWKCLEKDKEV